LRTSKFLLQEIYHRFHQNTSIQQLTILCAASTKSPTTLVWLNDLLQSGSFWDKFATVEALKKIGGDQSTQYLLAALRRTRNEQLVGSIARSLTLIAPDNNEVFFEVTERFYQCKNLEVRNSLLRYVHHLKTGREYSFLLRVIADQKVSNASRSLAVKIIVQMAKKLHRESLAASELECILASELKGKFKQTLANAIKSLSRR